MKLSLLTFSLLLTSCGHAGPPNASFLVGLKDGFLLPLKLLANLFGNHLHLYATANTGIGYAGGYLFGVVVIMGFLFGGVSNSLKK